MISGFLFHDNYFRKFQKVSKFVTPNSERKKTQVTFTASTDQAMHFFHGFSIFPCQPTYVLLRKIKKSPKKKDRLVGRSGES